MAFPATIVILSLGTLFILSGLIVNVIQVRFNPQSFIIIYITLYNGLCTHMHFVFHFILLYIRVLVITTQHAV